MEMYMRCIFILFGVGLIILLILIGSSSGEEWTTSDTMLEGVFALTMLIDRNQTLQIPANGLEEVGWARTVIGPHPSEGRVNAYFAVGTVLHAAVAYVLPQPYRLAWQSFWIGVEVNTIHSNAQLGLGVKISF